jgi:hypothetical protein
MNSNVDFDEFLRQSNTFHGDTGILKQEINSKFGANMRHFR